MKPTHDELMVCGYTWDEADQILNVAEKYLVGSWSINPSTCEPVTIWDWADDRKLLGQFFSNGVAISRYELDLVSIKVLTNEPRRMLWSMEYKSVTVRSGQTSTTHITAEGRNDGERSERRTLQSVVDGQYTIKDGVYSFGGKPSLSLFKCHEALIRQIFDQL